MATNSKQLVIDFGFDSKAGSNIAGALTVTGNLVTNGTFIANTFASDLIPDTSSRNLGNTTNRWVLTAGAITSNGALAVSNTASLGNTTITGFANVSTGVNTALLTVGTSFIANTTGAYHTGTVNAVSFTTSGLVVNTTAIATTSNTTLLGNSIGRFILSANTGDFSGVVTVSGNATLSGTLQTIAGNSSFDNGVLFVDATNNRVGINNTAPTVALEVTGVANVSLSVNSALFTVGTSFAANTTGVYHTGTVNASSLTVGSSFIANSTAIVSTGFANIATSVNSAILTVGSSFIANTTAVVSTGFANIATSVNSALLTVGTSFIANTTGVYHTGIVNTSSFTVGSAFIANTTGAYHTGTVQAAIFNSTSDVNSKYNIKTIQDPISKVMNMRGVTFTWKHSDADSMGLIAQEVEQVIPEVVNTDSEGKKSVSYDNIIGLLVEAIKHQQHQIDSLIADKAS